MINPHLAQPVVAGGKPVSDAHAAIIALHGRDRDPDNILSVCARVGRSDLAWLAPAAMNASWYPLGFMDEVEDNEPWLSHALERVDTLIGDLLAQGFGRENIVLLGFSQGACIAAEYALRHAHRYGALLIFTGSAISPPGMQRNHTGNFAGTPALVSGSAEDEWVPHGHMHETARLLKARGAHVTEHYYAGREHIVNDDETRLARRLLKFVSLKSHGQEWSTAPARTC